MSKSKLKPRRAGKNRLRITLINLGLFVVVASVLIWGVRNYLHIGVRGYTNDAQIEAYINPVNTRVSAYIKEIRFIEHQQVKKGDTLVVLDNSEILTQVAQAEAANMNALAGKKVVSSSVSTISNNVSVVESNIAQAKARLWNAEQNFNRYQNLLAGEAVTRQQFDQIKTEYEAQKAGYQALISQKNSSNLSVSEAKTRIAVSDAEIKRSKAALDMARLNLSYTVIKAPHDGVIGRRVINEGQLLQAGQQVATLVTDDNKWVVANFRENQMKDIQMGDKVDIRVDALGNELFEGHISAISEATGSKLSSIPIDNSTGNFVKVQQRIPVRIEFTDHKNSQRLTKLRAGMNVEVTLQ